MHLRQAFKYLFYGDYDPQWLIDAARPYSEEYPWLEDALTNYTAAKDSRYYIRFVDGSNPNKQGSEWQFKECIVLEHSEHREVHLDILINNKVGGVELFNELIAGSTHNA